MAPRSVSPVSISVAGHLLVGSALVLGPLSRPAELPPAGGVRAVLLGPAPPPPPPLALGSPRAKPRPERAARRATPKARPAENPGPVTASSAAETVASVPPVEPITPEEPATPLEMAGALEGKLDGSQEGVIDGVDGGVAGGVRDGKRGGVWWGTGGEVVAYDIPPRPLRQPRPNYPPAAAIKHVAGTVVVDVWIDRHGKVRDARVVESIQLLDEEALRTVYTWEFAPAMKRGVPVPSLARAYVTFSLL